MAKKRYRSFITSVLACAAFVAAAIWSWDLPVASVVGYGVLLLVLLLVIVVAALATAAILTWLRDRKKK
ncbi:hypothetical protein [Microbulbifer discodermiae]|uniref:hypothetical protein n=1 Tax=Microbulbifer sp. 2201CG32-9 TaxID=3232309 RepID=UPI00345C34CF